MKTSDYQNAALKVRLYHQQEISPLFSKLSYLYMGLNGETGELGEKLKKIIRDKDCRMSEQDKSLILGELADVLWYLTAIIEELDLTLDDVMNMSLEKIQGRIKRGTLQGEGDIR